MSYAPGQLHVNVPLTNLAVAFKPSSKGYLRDSFFPRLDVAHLSDTIRQISKPDALRLYDAAAGSEGKVGEVQFRLSDDLAYSCEVHALEGVIPDLDAKNADAALQFETRVFNTVQQAINTALEKFAVGRLRDASVMTANRTLTAAQRWDNYTSADSDPIGDMLAAREIIVTEVGAAAEDEIDVVNAVGFSNHLWKALKQHPAVLDRVRFQTGSTGAILTKKILADILGVRETAIKITAAKYTSSKQGATPASPTPAYKQFIGSDFVMAHVEEASLDSYGLGHEFAFSGYGTPLVVVRYRDEKRGALGAEVVRVASMVDYKVLVPGAGFLYKTCLDITNTAYGSVLD